MFDAHTVDTILNGSLLLIWAIVFALGLQAWRKYNEPTCTFFVMPTKYTMNWKQGWRKGSISIVRCYECHQPKLTPGFNSWNFVVPLDMPYEELAEFVRTAPVADYYAKKDLDILEAFRDMVCDPVMITEGNTYGDEALTQLLDHGVVLKHYDNQLVVPSHA